MTCERIRATHVRVYDTQRMLRHVVTIVGSSGTARAVMRAYMPALVEAKAIYRDMIALQRDRSAGRELP